MGSTWESLQGLLYETLNAEYRSEAEREKAIRDQMTYVMMTMLEKLRDKDI